MGNGYNAELDKVVGEPAKLKRSNNDREYFVIALRKYAEQETKVDFARYFNAHTGRQLRQPKLGRLTADEARRIGKALCAAADVVMGAEEEGVMLNGRKPGKANRPKGKATRRAKKTTQQDASPLMEDVQAAEEANLLLSGS